MLVRRRRAHVRVPGWTARLSAARMHSNFLPFAFSMADVHPDGSPWLQSPSASPRDDTPTIENSDGDHSMDDDDSGSVPKPKKMLRISSSGASSSNVLILPLQVVSSSGVSSSSGLAILPLQEGSALAKSQYSCINLKARIHC